MQRIRKTLDSDVLRRRGWDARGLGGLFLLWIVLGCGGFGLGGAVGAEARNAGGRGQRPTVAAEAMTLLRQNCVSCHGETARKSGLSVAKREDLMKGGESGAALSPGRPDDSLLIRVLGAEADPHMPPKKQLSPEEIRVLRRWVSKGAPWDESVPMTADAGDRVVQVEEAPASYRPGLAAALSPDEKRFAFGSGNFVQVHDLSATNFPSLQRVRAHPETIQSLAWSPEGRWLASGGYRRVILWEADGMRPAAQWTNGLKGQITALVFSRDAKRLLVGDSVAGRKSWVHEVDVASGTERAVWAVHDDTVFDLQLDPAGERVATAGGDRLIRLWDLGTRREVARLEGHGGAVFGLAFSTNGSRLVSAGADRELKVWDTQSREKIISLGNGKSPVTAVLWSTNGGAIVAATEAGSVFRYTDLKEHSGEQSSAAGTEHKVGETGDAVQRLVSTRDGEKIFAAGQGGMVTVWSKDGKALGRLAGSEGGDGTPAGGAALASAAPGTDEGGDATGAAGRLSFVRDVLPVLSKAGCNAGACHAKPEGQNGFKLSVFSFDPKADHGEIVREGRGRRVFPAAPGESLILLKPTLQVPHEGGERFKVGSEPYELLVRWIREGMIYQLPEEPVLARIEVKPSEKRYRRGGRETLQVLAHYSDASVRDVTRLASFDSNDKEIARVEEGGRVTAGNITGQGVIVARYMGYVADSKVTVPAERTIPAARYRRLPVNNFIDELAYRQFRELGIYPSEGCTDLEFLRRASLDTVGRLPSVEEVRGMAQVDASAEDGAGRGRRRKAGAEDELSRREGERERREAVIDRLLEDPAYADYWANKFADLFRPNPDRVGVKSILVLDQWLREVFAENRPFDRFARDILTAEGSNHRDGAAVIYRDRREPAELTTMFSQLFLGVRLECARCHHHPNEKWGQEDFYQFAAFFGPLKQKGAGLSPPISAGMETFYFAPGGEVKHPVTGAVMAPRPPDGNLERSEEGVDPRRPLADWLTRPDNPFFARAIVNRVWANFFGRGLVEPVDDFRISNPCVNSRLLDALAADFVRHQFDLKHLMRTILRSHLYQLSSAPNPTNVGDTKYFSRAYRRRLPAEVLMDAVSDVTGVPDTMAALPPGSRAMQAWSYKIDVPMLDAFGRPNASSDCPCERDTRTSVVQALHLMHSRNIQTKLAHERGHVRRLAAGAASPREVVTELYLRALSRPPTEAELEIATAAFSAGEATRQTATEDVLWALLNSAEFVFNH